MPTNLNIIADEIEDLLRKRLGSQDLDVLYVVALLRLGRADVVRSNVEADLLEELGESLLKEARRHRQRPPGW